MRFGAAAAVAVECAAAAALAGPFSVATSFFLKKEESGFCISFALRQGGRERGAWHARTPAKKNARIYTLQYVIR